MSDRRKKEPALHPTTASIRWQAWSRFMDLQAAHRVAAERMWAGTLASQFTAFELGLIPELLSPNDHRLLKSVTRATPEAHHD